MCSREDQRPQEAGNPLDHTSMAFTDLTAPDKLLPSLLFFFLLDAAWKPPFPVVRGVGKSPWGLHFCSLGLELGGP